MVVAALALGKMLCDATARTKVPFSFLHLFFPTDQIPTGLDHLSLPSTVHSMTASIDGAAPAVVLMLLVLLSPALAGAQTDDTGCSAKVEMFFKTRGSKFGTPSFITEALTSNVTVTVNRPLPPIILRLVTGTGPISDRPLDFRADGVKVTASIIPALRMGGNTVDVDRGEVLFDSLVIQAPPSNFTEKPVLVFTLTLPGELGGTELRLQTGPVTFVPDSAFPTPQSLRFAPYGFLRGDFPEKKIPSGSSANPVAIPSFWLEVLNAIGYVLPESSATTVVTVVANRGQVRPTTFTSQTGSIGIQQLTYVPNPGDPSPNVTFTFTAQNGGWSQQVSTSECQVLFSGDANAIAQFDAESSFFAVDNVGATAVLDIPMPPVVIQLYTSGMERDSSNTGTIITATSEQGELLGAEAVVDRGVATFADLTFKNVAPRSAVIKFRVGNQFKSVGAQNEDLFSGAISVARTAIKAKHLSFHPESWLRSASSTPTRRVPSGTGVDATTFIMSQPIIISLLDSAYQFDSLSGGVTLVASIDPPGVAELLSVLPAVTDGLSVIRRPAFRFSSGAKPFRLRFVDSGRARDPLDSGLIVLDDVAPSFSSLEACRVVNRGCNLTLSFAGDYTSLSSVLYDPEQLFFATTSYPVGEVWLLLSDAFGSVGRRFTFDTTTNKPPRIFAYTAADYTIEDMLDTNNNANEGVYQDGAVIFSCLQFKATPKSLVRIKFTAVDATGSRYDGIPVLQSGFVSVAATPTPNYALRFSTDRLSMINYPGQKSSAVLNVALLPIAVELVGSDSSLSDVATAAVSSSSSTSAGGGTSSPASFFVSVEASKGTLDPNGQRVEVVKGRAVFPSIRFLSLAELPTLTFTVTSGPSSRVVGLSIATGPVTLTPLPVLEYELAFGRDDSKNAIQTMFQSFTLDAFGKDTMRASVFVRDSAHQLAAPFDGGPPLQHTSSIAVESDQAVLTGSAEALVSPLTACGCANFSFTIGALKAGVNPGAAVFLRFVVLASSSPSLLMSKPLMAGPIQVLSASGATAGSAATTGATASCTTGGAVAPVVVVEFKTPIGTFQNDMKSTVDSIAQLMGLESDRVVMNAKDLKGVSRIEPTTLQTIPVTKAYITFNGPALQSSNQKSSAQLADEFMSLRPRCDAPTLGLYAVYGTKSDNDCNPTAFALNLGKARDCSSNGDAAECDCYVKHFVESAKPCAEEATLQTSLIRTCQELRTCSSIDIQNLCDGVLVVRPVNLTWLWIVLGSVGGIGLVLAVLKFTGVLNRNKSKLTFSADTDQQF